jgi:phage shock protein PspC (stress-responsive transcriptional regulator)
MRRRSETFSPTPGAQKAARHVSPPVGGLCREMARCATHGDPFLRRIFVSCCNRDIPDSGTGLAKMLAFATGAESPPPQGVGYVSKSADVPLFNRPDTLFGVCEGIGREFGLHPNILRLAFAIPMIWNPVAVIGTYVGLGVALFVSRKLVPAQRRSVEAVAAEPTAVPEEREVALAA